MAPTESLLAFLNPRQEFTAPTDLIPMDEYEERLAFAERIRKEHAFQLGREPERLPFTAVQFFAIMTMPIEILRRHNRLGFPHGLEDMNIIMPHFLQKPAGGGSDFAPGNDAQRREYLKRYQSRCMITNTDNPEVCHIIPVAWNANAKNMSKTARAFNSIKCLLDNNEFPLQLVRSISFERGFSDKVWNMALNHQLHKWWSKAYFGLKYLGTTYPDTQQATIHLQFRWMPQYGQKTDCLRPVLAGKQTIDGMFAGSPDHPFTNISFPPSSRPLRSGHTFNVTMEKTEAPNFTVMIKLQWALIQIAAMSGAGETPEFLREPGDDEGRVRQWLTSLDGNLFPVPEDPVPEDPLLEKEAP